MDKKNWGNKKIIVAITTIIGIISIPWWPNLFHYLHPIKESNLGQVSRSIRMNTINLSEIFTEYYAKTTSYDRQNFLNLYSNAKVYGSGSFSDISKPGDKYLVTLLLSDKSVSCYFNSEKEVERKLFLIKKNQNVTFTGVLNNSGIGWIVDNCTLLY